MLHYIFTGCLKHAMAACTHGLVVTLRVSKPCLSMCSEAVDKTQKPGTALLKQRWVTTLPQQLVWHELGVKCVHMKPNCLILIFPTRMQRKKKNQWQKNNSCKKRTRIYQLCSLPQNPKVFLNFHRFKNTQTRQSRRSCGSAVTGRSYGEILLQFASYGSVNENRGNGGKPLEKVLSRKCDFLQSG